MNTNQQQPRADMLCECGSIKSAVTFDCVRGKHCPQQTGEGNAPRDTVTKVNVATFDMLALLNEALSVIPNPDDCELAKSNIRQVIASLKEQVANSADWQKTAIRLKAELDLARGQVRELLAACKAVVGLARYNTKWNTGEPEPQPSRMPTLTPAIWYQLQGVIAKQGEHATDQMQAAIASVEGKQ